MTLNGRLGWVLGVLFLAAPLPAAQTIFPVSSQTNSLDNANIAPRAAAMGSAFVGLADDASALFSNPAGLARLGQGSLAANSNFWLSNIFQETLLLGFPLRGAGGFGLAVNYVHYGTFDGRDALGNPTTPYGADRLALEGGWGIEPVSGVSVGISGLGTQTTLANQVYSAFTVGFGLLLEPVERLRVGASYDNVSVGSAANAASAALNLGLSYEAGMGPSNRLTAALGGSIEPGAVNYVQVGLEYALESQYFIRAGYQRPLMDDRIEGLSGLTVGVGLLFQQFTFDYAFLPYGDLGASHRASVGIRFETSKAHPADQAADPRPAVSPVTILAPAQEPPRPAASGGGSDSLSVKFDFSEEGLEQASALSKQGRYGEAARMYQEILRGDPRNARAWMELGNIYRIYHRKSEAIHCYERALGLNPGNAALSEWLERYKSSEP
jgi:tetratricopeptide (TPR) repeat protein